MVNNKVRWYDFLKARNQHLIFNQFNRMISVEFATIETATEKIKGQ